jgi:outer membrane protein
MNLTSCGPWRTRLIAALLFLAISPLSEAPQSAQAMPLSPSAPVSAEEATLEEGNASDEPTPVKEADVDAVVGNPMHLAAPYTPAAQVDPPASTTKTATDKSSVAKPRAVLNGPARTPMLGEMTLNSDLERSDLVSMVNTVLSASVVKVREVPIDLDSVLKLVETQNLPIQRDRLTSQMDRTLFYRSLSRMLPDVRATYTATRFKGVIQLFGDETIPVEQTQVVPQLQAIWVINPGGQDVFRSLAARSRSKEALLRLDSTKQEQLAEAARRYYEFLTARIQRQNTEAGLLEAQSQLALSEARWKAGVGTRLDVMRSKSQLAERETDQVNAGNRVDRAEQDLLNTLNLDPDLMLTSAVAEVQPRILVPLSAKTDALVAHAVSKNPALMAETMELAAIASEKKAILGRVIPTVTLQTYVNGTGPDLQTLGLTRFGGITLQSNLLDSMGTAIPLDYRERQLAARRQKVAILQRLRDLQSQVIKAFLDSRAAARSILTSREALLASQEAYRLAMGRFKAGLGINLDVLNAQTDLTAARTRITAAILDFNHAQINLLEALGETSTTSLSRGLSALPPIKPPSAAYAKAIAPLPASKNKPTPNASNAKRNSTP